MTRVSQGARQRHFIFMVGISDRLPYIGNNPIGKTRVLMFRRESESLVVSNSRRHISPKPIIYVDIWIYFFYQPSIHRASAHYRR